MMTYQTAGRVGAHYLRAVWSLASMLWAVALLQAQPGGPDPLFQPAGTVGVFALQTDGKIIASGEFLNGGTYRRLARLNANGSLDPTFNSAGPDGGITHLVALPGGGVLVGGDFGQFSGQPRLRLARLLPTGALDPDWSAGSVLQVSTIAALAVEPDGSTLIGINMTGGGSTSDGLVRLRPNGARDTDFPANGAVNGSVETFHFLPNDDFYIGGRFTTVHGVPRAGIARLKADGSLDPTFDPGTGVNGDVKAIGVQLDGRVLISGEFDQVAGFPRFRLARLHADGNFDDTFDAGMPGTVLAMATQADGKVVLAGMFSYIYGVRRGGVARLLPDGSLDRDFLTGEGSFRQVALQADGLILAGGGSSPGLCRFLNEPGSFPGRFELEPVSSEVVEGTGEVTITVHRDGGQTGLASVKYAAMLYTQDLVRGTLTFADGQREATFGVPIPDDRVVDPWRIISLLIYDPSPGAQLGYNQYGEIRVRENDTGFQIESYPGANEDAQVITIQVARLGADFSPAQVDYVTGDGTAKAGRDYVARSGTLHFAQGETAQAISIALLDNPAVQGLHAFSVMLRNPSNNLILMNGGIAHVTLLDVVSRIAFAGYGDYATNEAAGVAFIPVQRTERTNTTVTVHYQTADDTAQAGMDYQTASGTLMFAPGEILKAFAVPLLDNAEPQNSRTLHLRLSDPTGGAVLDLPTEATLRTLIILDDDRPGDLDFAFNPNLGFGATGVRVALTPAQQILASGSFFSPWRGLWRLNADGSVDTTFQAALTSVPSSVLAANDGRCWTGASSDPPRILAADGSVAWTSPWQNGVGALALQPDQKVIVAGGGIPWGLGVARHLPTGNVDAAFAGQGANNLMVAAVVVQPDGRILCGGSSPGTDGLRCLVRLNADGTLDDGFMSQLVAFEGADSQHRPAVYTLLLQPDGRILVGGYFVRAGGVPVPHVVRLQADGTLDPTWTADSDATAYVSQLALQGDGRILSVVAVTRAEGLVQGMLVRREPNGALDPSFAPDVHGVAALALQGDGRILLAGGFNRVNGQPRSALVRLQGNPEAGAGVVSFATIPANIPESADTVVVQVQRTVGTRGRILVPYAVSAGTAVVGQDIAAATGVVEFGDGDAAPKTITIQLLTDGQPDGDKSVELSLGLPVGGAVRGEPCTVGWTVQDVDCVIEFSAPDYTVRESDAVAVVELARRGNLHGPVAVGYSTRAGSAMPGDNYQFIAGVARFEDGQSEVAVTVSLMDDRWGQPDREFWVDLTTPSAGATLGATRSARVVIADDDRPGAPRAWFGPLPAWAPPPQFSQDLFAEVSDLALDSSRRVLALFRGISGPLGGGRPGPSSVVRFTVDGAFDPNFGSGWSATEATFPDDDAQVLAVRADGSVLVGTTTRLARLNPEGRAEAGAFGEVTGYVAALKVEPDGSFLAGGALTLGHPEAWCHLVRRLADGQPDDAFAPVVASSGGDPRAAFIWAHARDGQGRILVGGAFDMIQGESHWGLARLEPSGQPDQTFEARVYGPTPGGGEGRGTVRRIVVQPDGRILVAGVFNRLGSVARPGLARLLADGTVDPSFVPALPFGWAESTTFETIQDIALQPDGRILLGGVRVLDNGWNGAPSTEGRSVRLNADGSLDALFDVNGMVATLTSEYRVAVVTRVLLDTDGSFLVGGLFNRINDQPASGVARISGGVALGFTRVWRADADRVALEVVTPLPATVRLERSTDFRTWTPVASRAVPAGTFTWEVPVAADEAVGFYRASVQP